MTNNVCYGDEALSGKDKNALFKENRVRISGLLLLIILGGLALRWPMLNRPPREYWTVRQYPSLIQARDIYQERLQPLIHHAAEPVGNVKKLLPEAPLREWVAAGIYSLIGGEAYWPLVVISLLGWGCGAVFLYLLSLRYFPAPFALFTVAYYMLLPYGLLASVSIQPDIWLIALLLTALWAIQRYGEKESVKRYVISLMLSSFAIFIKPGVTQFALCFAYLFVVYSRNRWYCLKRIRNYVWAFCVLFPSGLYLVLMSSSGMRTNWGINVHPEYLLTLHFWKGWLGNLVLMFGPVGLFLAILGLVLLFTRIRDRAVLLGFGLGYMLQCVFTTWTTIAHDYWHLQVVPLMAIGMGSIIYTGFQLAGKYARKYHGREVVVTAAVIGLAIMGWQGYASLAALDDDADYIAACREIGEAVQHSPYCVIMDYDTGNSMRYFADIDGEFWPFSEFVEKKRAAGQALSAWEEADTRGRLAIVRDRLEHEPAYFICSRLLADLYQQPDLGAYLEHCPVVAEGYRFKVWKLPVYDAMGN